MTLFNLVVIPPKAMVDELGGITPAGGGIAPAASGSLKKIDRVRSVFPETWLWTNTTVG